MTALVDSYSFAMRFAFVPALDPSKPTATAKKRGVLGSYHPDRLMNEQNVGTLLAAWQLRRPDAERQGDKNQRRHHPVKRTQAGIVDLDPARRRKAFHGPYLQDLARPASRGKATISRPLAPHHASTIATARVQPADARSIFTGKHATVNPVDGRASRL